MRNPLLSIGLFCKMLLKGLSIVALTLLLPGFASVAPPSYLQQHSPWCRTADVGLSFFGRTDTLSQKRTSPCEPTGGKCTRMLRTARRRVGRYILRAVYLLTWMMGTRCVMQRSTLSDCLLSTTQVNHPRFSGFVLLDG